MCRRHNDDDMKLDECVTGAWVVGVSEQLND